MGYLDDDFGNKSMMRKIVWLLTITMIVWMAIELIANIWFTAVDKQYEIHVSFILAAIGIVLGGKVTQKGVEAFKNKEKTKT